MAKIKKNIKTAKSFFTKGIWTTDEDELSKFKANLVKFIQLAIITLKTYNQQTMGPQAVALSYFSTMAVIPLVAVIFAVTGGLGLEDKMAEYFMNTFGSGPVVQFLIDKAGNIIAMASSGTAGVISSLTFIWFILWLMFNVERCFNNVWKVDINRNIFKRFSMYIGILILIPFVLFIFCGFPIIYTNIFNLMGLDLNKFPFLSSFGMWVLFYLITSFTLTAMYKYIPNQHVRYHHAWRAAFLCGLVFVIFQYIYLESQTMVTGWNGVYGALTAIPLFMIWLNISWQIILYGASLSYALQNRGDYKEQQINTI